MALRLTIVLINILYIQISFVEGAEGTKGRIKLRLYKNGQTFKQIIIGNTSMSKRAKTRGEKLLNLFEAEVRIDEMAGTQPPELQRHLKLDFQLARANLLTYIQLLESLVAINNKPTKQ